MLSKAFSLLLLAAALASSVCARAQVLGDGAPNIELYGGYSFLFKGSNVSDAGQVISKANQIVSDGKSGWDASLKIPILGALLGIKGDVSGNWLKDGQPDFKPAQYYFMAGPQVGIHLGGSLLFAHGMVGSSLISKGELPTFNPGSTLAIAAGGGFDLGLTRHLAWRLTGDFYNTHFKTPSTAQLTANNVINQVSNSNGRVSTGPVFRF